MDSSADDMSAAVSETTVESTHPGTERINNLLHVSATDCTVGLLVLYLAQTHCHIHYVCINYVMHTAHVLSV